MEGKASDWRPGPTVCRCCLTEGCYKDISTEYFWMGKREVYAEMLSETLNVSIAFSKSGGPNSNSRLICEPCIARLRDASEFKRQVIDCEKTFMHHLDPGSSSRSREFNVETIGEVKVEVVKREKTSLSDDDFDDRPDFLDVDTDDDLDDQPLTKLASKIPKKEVDLLDLLDSSQITVKRKSNLKLKETPPKKIIKKKEVVKASVSKAPPAKQAEKKKDEWTTTDITNRMPVDIKRYGDIYANTRRISQDEEWITTDIMDTIQTDTKRECPSYTKENPQSYKKQNAFVVDNEWIISDMTKQVFGKNIISKLSGDLGLNSQTTLKQGIPLTDEWTMTAIGKLPANTKHDRSLPATALQRDCAAVDHAGGGGTNWPPMSIGRQSFKIVVADGNRERPLYNLMKTRLKSKNSNSRVKAVKESKKRGKPTNKRVRQPKKFLHNARLLLRHTTAIPLRMDAGSLVPCFACPSKFMDPFLFRDHFLAEHKSADKSRGMHLFNNVQTRADITDLACLLCAQLFDTLEEAAGHLIQEHKINIDLKERLGLVPLKFPKKGLYECLLCQRKSSTFRDLYRHSGSHYHFHVCETCGKQFESFEALRHHRSHSHVDGHRCRYCKAVFASAQEVKQHVKNNDRCSTGYCKICKKSFGYTAQLQEHRESVHGAPKKVYECPECSKVFEKRMQQYFHFKREHTDQYKCEHCGKKFTNSKSMKLHLLVHTGDRPFKCQFCQQGFKKPSYIKTHEAKCKI